MKIIAKNSKLIFSSYKEEPTKKFTLSSNSVQIPLSGSLSVGDNYDFYAKVDSMSNVSSLQLWLGNGRMTIDTASDYVIEGKRIEESGKWYHYKGTFYNETASTIVSTLKISASSNVVPSEPITISVKPVDFFG